MTVMRQITRTTCGLLLVMGLMSRVQAVGVSVEENGPVIAKVYFPDRGTLNELAARLDILTVRHREGYFTALLNAEQIRELELRGRRVDVDQRAMERLLEYQQLGIAFRPCYRTVGETYADMARLASTQPSLAQWTDIGDSWRKAQWGGTNGYDIFVLRLTRHDRPGPKFPFLLLAATHARELSTAETAVRFSEWLVSRYGLDADITWLLDYGECHVIPLHNPDGRIIAEEQYYQRKNANSSQGGGCNNPPDMFNQAGVDLNRNADFHWGASGVSWYPCDPTYPGVSAASEPEEVALEQYARSIFADQRGPLDTDAAPTNTEGAMITLHSYGNYVLYPWGWASSQAPNHEDLRLLGLKMGYFNRYEVDQASAGLYLAAGGSDDWAYGELGIAAYTFEMGDEFFDTCEVFSNSVIAANMKALLYAFKAARRPYLTPQGPDATQPAASPSVLESGQTLHLTAIADDTRSYSANGSTRTAQPISAARYSVDQPSWITGVVCHAMSAADGAFDETIEPVEAFLTATNLTPGRHLIFVEARNALGYWGVPSAVFVEIGAPDLTIDSLNQEGLVLRWLSLTNTVYGLEQSTNLLEGFKDLAQDLPFQPEGVNLFTNPPQAGPLFIRLKARPAP